MLHADDRYFETILSFDCLHFSELEFSNRLQGGP